MCRIDNMIRGEWHGLGVFVPTKRTVMFMIPKKLINRFLLGVYSNSKKIIDVPQNNLNFAVELFIIVFLY